MITHNHNYNHKLLHLGKELWKAMVKDHPNIIWRSRKANKFNSWYDKQADGRIENDEWVFYYKGLVLEQKLNPKLIQYMELLVFTIPITFNK